MTARNADKIYLLGALCIVCLPAAWNVAAQGDSGHWKSYHSSSEVKLGYVTNSVEKDNDTEDFGTISFFCKPGTARPSIEADVSTKKSRVGMELPFTVKIGNFTQTYSGKVEDGPNENIISKKIDINDRIFGAMASGATITVTAAGRRVSLSLNGAKDATASFVKHCRG